MRFVVAESGGRSVLALTDIMQSHGPRLDSLRYCARNHVLVLIGAGSIHGGRETELQVEWGAPTCIAQEGYDRPSEPSARAKLAEDILKSVRVWLKSA